MPTTTGLATSFITFSRPGASGGGATVTDRDGKIKWAGNNLLTNSESFDANAWAKNGNTTVSANVSTAPDGATTADKLVEVANTGAHGIDGPTVSFTAGAAYTFRVFVKAGTVGVVQLILGAPAFGFDAYANFNASTGVVGSLGSAATSSITAIGSGWYLCSMTATASSTTTTTAGIYLTNNDANAARAPSYAGSTSRDVLLWGAHLYRSDMQMQLNPAMPAGMQSYYPTTPRNMVGYSEDFSNAYWTKLSVTATAASVTNPAGLNGASLLYPTSTGTDRATYRSPNITGVASTPYTLSVYAKANGINFLYFGTLGGGTSPASTLAFFDLQNGTRTQVGTAFTSATITAVGNGWYRCTATASPASASLFPVFGLADANNSTTVTASGTNGIYLWGAQLSDSASLDTYVPVYGAAVTSAAYYAPRLDFDGATLAARGLLVEEARTNLLLHTAAFDNAAWSKSDATVTANAVASPDGTTSADKLEETTATASHYVSQSATTTATTHAFSCYVKAAELSFVLFWNSTANFGRVFNVGAGTLSGTVSGVTQATAEITSVGNGWYRCTIYGTCTAASNSFRIYAMTDATTFSYAGTAGSGVYLYGAQVEAGSFATSYIPNGSAVAGATRTADVASVSTGAFPYSGTEGTVVVAFNSVWAGTSTLGAAMALSDGTLSNRIENYSSSLYHLYVVTGGSVQADIDAGTVSVNTVTKIGSAFAENNFAAVINGGTVGTDTSGTMPTVNRLYLGAGANGGSQLNGHVRQITYIPRRLSASELQSRTA